MTTDTIASLVRCYNQWMDSNDQQDQETAEQLLEMMPSLLDYDENGHFVGACSNENGWTA